MTKKATKKQVPKEMEIEEELSTYQQLQQIQNKEVPIPKVSPPNPNQSKVIRIWGMSRADRITKYE